MTLPALHNTGVLYRRILSQFPQDISLAFAYGSGVFKQHGTNQGQMDKNMLDFVFAVDDPVTWHTMNLLQNRKHYSILKLLGPTMISSIQNEHGASVYYNTLVPVEERIIKYGVISTESLIDDLSHWKTMYVAGRLHKPVKMMVQNENGKLRAALVANLKSAVIASFLMLPESFTEEDLFLQIAGLSYAGDFRMVIGEDKSKVANIVKDNIQHFRILYSNILRDCPQVVYKPQQGKLEVDKSPEGQFIQLMALPRTLQQRITKLVDPPGKKPRRGGDSTAGCSGPRLWSCRTTRYFIYCEILQYNTEYQRHCYSWHVEDGVIQLQETDEDVEGLEEEAVCLSDVLILSVDQIFHPSTSILDFSLTNCGWKNHTLPSGYITA
uniref:Phosphatidate cytidylyltransferase, mitochondrial n=1 Tax=Sander lucioperca TaxID=283035 RepID=A0A8C9Y9F3_SANLU